MNMILNYIGGENCIPISESFLDNYRPADGTVYSQVPDSDKDDVEQAVQAAENAYTFWSAKSVEERSQYCCA